MMVNFPVDLVILKGEIMSYSNSVPTVESLRKEGYKVRVYHARCWLDENGMGGMMDLFSKKDRLTQYSKLENITLSSWGGRTTVELTSPNGQYHSIGRYNHGNGSNKQFNRKIGLQAAIGRALKNLDVVRNTCGSESLYVEQY